MCLGRNISLLKLKDYGLGQSVGLLYTDLINVIGFSRFEEYKAMGLAPYGDPSVFGSLFQNGFALLPEGEYRVVNFALLQLIKQNRFVYEAC